MSKTVYVHYLARQEGGPIRTVRKDVYQGDQTATVCAGGEYAVACDPARDRLAVVNPRTKAVREFFLATGQPDMVSCPQCKRSPLYLRDATPETSVREV